ncbi:MAG: glycoside hydrolase family 99-like domain-containing protein [Firmicutes bacterium]|nr:glycoside hydrolase family 99-like domain-containing protein [Bacillota bacterium]
MGFDIAAYYFPNYHIDATNEEVHGPGWTEWELVKHATPRFPGHQQPKVPLWGYEDESAPAVMQKKIDAAVDAGINIFIFDWYYYRNGPCRHKALEEGFLRASNNNRMKFAVMWANHDWLNIHPAGRTRPYEVLVPGDIDRQTFVEATNRVINVYFSHPSYWRIDGALYFSIYELGKLIENLGGVESTKAAFQDFRHRVRDAGLGNVHLNAVVWGLQNLPNESILTNPSVILRELEFDSATSYVWIHHILLQHFPSTAYRDYWRASLLKMKELSEELGLDFFPNVTMGWDPSPRTIQTEVYENIGYPYTSVLVDNTPEEFLMALKEVKKLVDANDTGHKIITINAWNEWTEGSYLEPDTIHGFEYLNAIKEVFC